MGQLIVFDMEWNMGYQPRTFQYHGEERLLRGEIIQIGAVKMEGQEIRETFRVNLRPRIFKKLHHHVAKVTGLTQKDLNEGLPISEGLKKFRAFCGEDAVLGEWGLDDVPVLKQNLFLLGLDESWPGKWCDLQRVFTAQHPRKEGEGMALSDVVERLGIEKDEAFHDALADALYTAKVMQHLDLQAGLAAYPDEAEQLREMLCPAGKVCFDFASWPGIVDGEIWHKNHPMRCALCPDCGAPLLPDKDGIWLKRGNNGLYSMGRCKKHGPVMIHLRRSHLDGLHYTFARATEKPSEEEKAKWEKDRKIALKYARRAVQEKTDAAPGGGQKKAPLPLRPVGKSE